MKAFKRIFIGGVAVVIAIPILFIIGLIAGPAVNDAKADKIEKAFQKLEMPAQTELVETVSFCGNTSGTGNHVEIWSGFLVKSELSKTELQEWYMDAKIPDRTYEPMVWSVPEDLTMHYPEPHSFIHFAHFNGMTEAKGYYIIGGYFDAPTQMDLRGH